MAFGTTVVDLGVDITWEELVEASRAQRRLKPVELEVREVTEIVRGPPEHTAAVRMGRRQGRSGTDASSAARSRS
jgi:hypothetical protein